MKYINFYNLYSDDGARYFHFGITRHTKEDNADFLHGHCHEFLELNFIKNGRGKYYIRDAEYDINPGDIFIINETEYHRLEVHSDDFLIYVVHCEKHFICPDEKYILDRLYLKPFLGHVGDFPNKVNGPANKLTRLRDFFLDMENEIISRESYFELFLKIDLLRILAYLSRDFYLDYSPEFMLRSENEIKTMHKVFTYIELKIAEEITLQELASFVHLSPQYFSALFKKAYGQSPMRYIQQKRIERALELLRKTNKGIAEIAGLCGFENLSNFYKAFKRVTGSVPSDIRENEDRSLHQNNKNC